MPRIAFQRTTSKASERQNNNISMVCEDIVPYGITPEEQCIEEEYLTYCDDGFLQSPEY